MNRRWILGVILLLSGCATTWSKPGLDVDQFERESYGCERDIAYLPPTQPAQLTPSWGPAPDGGLGQALANIGAMFATIGARRDMYERCMQALGYEKVD